MPHPLPVIANTFRCALNWTGPGGQTATNVIHIRSSSSVDIPNGIFTAMEAAVDIGMWNLQVTGASVTDIAITPLDGVSATQHFTPSVPANWTGQNGTDFDPAVSVLVKLQTNLRGRTKRGRIFLPFVEKGAAVDGLISSGSASALSAAWQDFNDDMFGASTSRQIVIASYKLATAEDVLVFTAELPLATQRRRQGRLRSA